MISTSNIYLYCFDAIHMLVSTFFKASSSSPLGAVQACMLVNVLRWFVSYPWQKDKSVLAPTFDSQVPKWCSICHRRSTKASRLKWRSFSQGWNQSKASPWCSPAPQELSSVTNTPIITPLVCMWPDTSARTFAACLWLVKGHLHFSPVGGDCLSAPGVKSVWSF